MHAVFTFSVDVISAAVITNYSLPESWDYSLRELVKRSSRGPPEIRVCSRARGWHHDRCVGLAA